MYKPFQKIFVFDINPGKDDITKELIIGKIGRVVKNTAKYETIVILSHSNLSILKTIVKDIGLESGYLISDNGARIYDVSAKKIIFDSLMNKDEVSAIVHFAIMQNALVLLSGNQKEYGYSVNLLNALSLDKRHYVDLPYTNNYHKLIKFINSTIIYSVLVYHSERSKMLECLHNFNSLAKDWSYSAIPGQHSYFVVTSNDVDKYRALLKVMEYLRISNFDNVYYYALNTISDQCVKSFKNVLLHQDVALNSDYFTNIDMQANTDNMITNIRNAFFADEQNISNDTYSTKVILDTKKLVEIMKDARGTKKL